jgi:hypothetical protein
MKTKLLSGLMMCAVFLTAGIPSCAGKDGAFDNAAALRGRFLAALTDFRPEGFTETATPAAPAGTLSRKKPVLAAALSAAVPGAGEFYAGSWIKGTVFIAIEVAAWAGYAHYTDKGNELRTTFRHYADTHWFKLGENPADPSLGYDPNDPTVPSTHGLPESKTQQYYEMIGKYDQFEKGWDDWSKGVLVRPDMTPHRDYYESMRHDHNHQLINASRCTMAALTNHLLSALDAAWTVHRRNRSIRATLGTDVIMAQSEALPVLSLRMAW